MLLYPGLYYFLAGFSEVKTLYHGSPFKLNILEPRTPRGDNEFNTQTGVYLSSNRMEAMLYSLARDKERNNKGWGLKGGKLYLVEEHWVGPTKKYSLNDIGYLHIIQTDKAEQNPYNPEEFIVKSSISPVKIEEITYEMVKENVIILPKEEYKKIFY